MQPRLKQQIDFLMEIDKLKHVYRQNLVANGSRRENDAEHSWHISVMALLLSEYADDDVDLFKVIKMLLIHDVVEIYAGDTFCYDIEAGKDKEERELKAAEQIFGILDEEKGRELRELWDEFEEKNTKEALFAASMDRLQPFINNYYSGGGTWKKFNVPKSAIYERIAPLKKISKRLWEFTTNMIEDAFDRGYIERE
ncbi:MAG: HD domain-containing protein [Tissierellia bacterium]|nr:HD domain-containing protein [Tissierellia bacterium]